MILIYTDFYTDVLLDPIFCVQVPVVYTHIFHYSNMLNTKNDVTKLRTWSDYHFSSYMYFQNDAFKLSRYKTFKIDNRKDCYLKKIVNE